ncbi:MAG: hypothetical protein RL531_745 [Actinomycetota bacterium]
MPVPIPEHDVLREPPSRDEVVTAARAKVAAVAGEAGLAEIQRHVLQAHIRALTGFEIDLEDLEPLGASAFAQAMRHRDEVFRIRQVQTMLLAAFVVDPIPEATVERIREYALELSIDDSMIDVARALAVEHRDLAMADFMRSGYHAHPARPLEDVLHTHRRLHDEWDAVEHDPELAAQWSALEHCPDGSLGRGVWEFYRARGFSFPGEPGSAPPLLAQHDFVHIVADYGSTVESEIEVFGLVARANDDPHAFSLLAGVISLFETGRLERATIFEHDPHHISHDSQHMATRLADAMRRGAIVGAHTGGEDLLTVDWFEHVDDPVHTVRERLGIPAKSPDALAAGSVGPWEPGGISRFQLEFGRHAAEVRGEPYDAHGAAVLPT